MKSNHVLSVVAISSLIALSGCAESQTMGTTVVKSVGSLVNEVVTGTIVGVQQGLGSSPIDNKKVVTSSPQKLPASDMVYLFGDMEGGCLGKNLSFKTFDQSQVSLADSIKGVSEDSRYFVKPRSQWLSAYRDTIKDVKIKEGNEFTAYHLIFKDGIKYRGQPLEEYIFMFRPESSGAGEALRFAPTANLSTVLPNFKSYKMEYWDEIIDMGATYNSQNKTITCLFD
ncbi:MULTISPECIES: hypothetical protein [unclassified Psychrobacter]|uniref:hypothetical protein n=1 Tax=unclassified Psychrobacter TaxID=196806 RepID=UPI0040383EA7